MASDKENSTLIFSDLICTRRDREAVQRALYFAMSLPSTFTTLTVSHSDPLAPLPVLFLVLYMCDDKTICVEGLPVASQHFCGPGSKLQHLNPTLHLKWWSENLSDRTRDSDFLHDFADNYETPDSVEGDDYDHASEVFQEEDQGDAICDSKDAQQTHERAAGAGQRHPAEVAATQRFLMRDLLRRVGSAGETERGGEDKKAASPSRTKFFSFPSPPTSPISLSISSLVPHCRGTARTFRESMRFTDPTRPCSQQQLDVTSECLPSAPASPSRFKRLQNSFSTCRRKRDPGSTSPKMSRQPTF